MECLQTNVGVGLGIGSRRLQAGISIKVATPQPRRFCIHDVKSAITSTESVTTIGDFEFGGQVYELRGVGLGGVVSLRTTRVGQVLTLTAPHHDIRYVQSDPYP